MVSAFHKMIRFVWESSLPSILHHLASTKCNRFDWPMITTYHATHRWRTIPPTFFILNFKVILSHWAKRNIFGWRWMIWLLIVETTNLLWRTTSVRHQTPPSCKIWLLQMHSHPVPRRVAEWLWTKFIIHPILIFIIIIIKINWFLRCFRSSLILIFCSAFLRFSPRCTWKPSRMPCTHHFHFVLQCFNLFL